MQVRVLYFASLREKLGSAAETLELAEAASVADLLALLRARGGVWAEALAEGRPVRAARNQDMAKLATVLAAGDEVAFFPPVTGG
jgi:molybdopterin synthase sulfur carrier subunit